jgi:hypothetical protein
MMQARIGGLGLTVALVTAVTGCGGGGTLGGDDGRMAAIQAALDARPITITVPSGTTCYDDAFWGGIAPHHFVGLSYVTVKPAGTQHGFMGTQPCTTVTWAKSTHFVPQIGNDERGQLPVGHLVVDKVGEEQEISGVKVTPFKSHFEWFPIGKDMLARNLAKPVSQDADQEAQLFKDADGHWVAQIVIV